MNQEICTTLFHIYVRGTYPHNRGFTEEHRKQPCIPDDAGRMDYEAFLFARAKLMAKKIQKGYRSIEPA